jgi:hypothetical protein
MVPTARAFFDQVHAAFVEVADRLGLTGPSESEFVLPTADYTGGGVEYSVFLELREGSVNTRVCIESESAAFTVDIEPLAVAAGIAEGRGGISFSARNLKQMKKSLAGQLRCVELVHPALSDDPVAAVELMRGAGAREWGKRPERGDGRP